MCQLDTCGVNVTDRTVFEEAYNPVNWNFNFKKREEERVCVFCDASCRLMSHRMDRFYIFDPKLEEFCPNP